jgi:hypothetical protein
MAEAAEVQTIEPTDWQARVLALPETFDLALTGGRGGGKSYACLLLALRHVEQYKQNARVLVVRKDFPSLRDLEGEARNLFRTAYGKSLGHNAQEHQFKFPSGAVVRFDQIAGPEDFFKFQGQSYSLIIVDEAGQYHNPQPLDMLRSSLRSKAGVPCRLILSANPAGAGHHWILQRHVAGVSPWHVYVDRASQREFITAPSTLADNEHLPADYRRQIEAATATDEELRKAWISGDWFISRGAYFASVFDENRNVVPAWPDLPGGGNGGLLPKAARKSAIPKRPPPHMPPQPARWRFWLTLDHGSAAPCIAYIVAQSPGDFGPDGRHYPKDSLILLDEVAFVDGGSLNQGLHLTVPRMAEDIVERCRAWGVPPEGVADDAIFARHGSQQGTIGDEYRKAGVALQPARKGDRLGGWQMMRKLLANAGQPDVPGLYISERCSYWLKTVPMLPRDERRLEDVDTKAPDHAADATRYGLVHEPETFTKRKAQGF